MYRPVPETLRVWVPPVPVVVEKIVVQVAASAEVWIWNAVAYAASQFRTTLQIVWVDPRSTCSHCGSENALDHRVPVFPSVAADAGNEALWIDDAVVGWLSAILVVPQPPPLGLTVQPNEVDPAAPVVSVAVTVTFDVPVAVGVPEISPDERFIDSPAGAPAAPQVTVWPHCDSRARICRLTR